MKLRPFGLLLLLIVGCPAWAANLDTSSPQFFIANPVPREELTRGVDPHTETFQEKDARESLEAAKVANKRAKQLDELAKQGWLGILRDLFSEVDITKVIRRDSIDWDDYDANFSVNKEQQTSLRNLGYKESEIKYISESISFNEMKARLKDVNEDRNRRDRLGAIPFLTILKLFLIAMLIAGFIVWLMRNSQKINLTKLKLISSEVKSTKEELK